MPDPFNDDAAIETLADIHRHATKHGLTASGVDVSHLRYEGGEEAVEVVVRTGSYTYPRDFVDWITSFSEPVRVRVERRDGNHGNDLLFWAKVESPDGLVRWRIHWHVVIDQHGDRGSWYRGGQDFLKQIAFIKARETRFLDPSEVEKLIAWGHTFQWPGEEAS